MSRPACRSPTTWAGWTSSSARAEAAVAEQSWADGYVVDVGYVHGFYGELAPSALGFAALMGGVRPPAFDAPFTYYELGCGQGATTAVLAAANPQGRFYGVDFNPTHIHNARALAGEAGLDNVEFLEKSFAEALALELPEAEVIALHGVWSWVSAENRAHIVEFIRRRLKPGGLVLVSYNALPGLAQVAPLQRLLADLAGSGAGEVLPRMRRAIELVQRLDKAGAGYFALSPAARVRLSQIGRQDPRYLAHEYLNATWMPCYHADVAKALGEAKLAYAASAVPLNNLGQLVLKPEWAKLVAEAPDRTMAETLADFARNTVFRKDVFTRGAPRPAPAELEALLDAARFSLARPRAQCQLSMKTSAGDLTLEAAAYAPVLDALARGPMTFRELLAAPECARLGGRARVRQAVFALAALDNVLPALPAAGEEERRARTRRFNAALLARKNLNEYGVLASPVLGSGLALPLLDRLFLASGKAGAEAVAFARSALAAAGMTLKMGEQPARTEADAARLLEARAEKFFGEDLPYYRLAGVAA